ncbi:MAG: carboxypeptidase regulatory-like domain-containing protein [Geminicoccaceae bacterium]|nr:MAG: carboxypeptidase regulatory-like domain-containing protein [Geminicoccaceae bacterium]
MWFGSDSAGRCGLALLALVLVSLAPAPPVLAHAAFLELRPVEGIAVQGRYDDGTVMAGAQMAVFAPNDPARPWLTGVTDDEGWFRFVPDPAIEGRWTVQARQAGHGAMAYVEVGGEGEAMAAVMLMAGGDEAFSPLQRGVMTASVVWGLIGTALFFQRRRAA